ncbi:MAG: YdcH family protein [Gammaproteobacteria bacterium]|nr:YdcH family protein [Gammaproteobacteria bacterium]
MDKNTTTKLKLQELRLEHGALDDAISRLSEDPAIDQFKLQRLKRRKLQLKDFIAKLEDILIPNLDA